MSTRDKQILVGPSGAGQLAKLCNQLVTATALVAVSEMMVFAKAGGADPDKVRTALVGGFADSKVLQLHGKRMVARNFAPGVHVRTFVKDLDAAMKIADEAGLDLPIVRLARQIFAQSEEHGSGEHDISSIVLEAEVRNPSFRVGSRSDAAVSGSAS